MRDRLRRTGREAAKQERFRYTGIYPACRAERSRCASHLDRYRAPLV